VLEEKYSIGRNFTRRGKGSLIGHNHKINGFVQKEKSGVVRTKMRVKEIRKHLLRRETTSTVKGEEWPITHRGRIFILIEGIWSKN